MERACNFSESVARTWYCYHEGAQCAELEKTLQFTTALNKDFYGISDILKTCSKDAIAFNNLETNFQQPAFWISYNPIANEGETSEYSHWIFGKYATKTQNFESILKSQLQETVTLTVIKNFHPTLKSQIDQFWQKLKNRQIIVIGDSLGRQVIDFMQQVAAQKGKCNGWLNVIFWGVTRTKGCDISDGFNPKIALCTDLENTSKTQFVFIPHGKPLQHGGCSPQRMPWMTDTFKRIDEFADLKSLPTTIILTPGAHFSAANPSYFYNRLLELKEDVYKFKQKYPNVNIIFKTTNYFPGDYSQQIGTISAYNSKRMDRISRAVFNDHTKVKMLDLYDRTELIYEMFAKTTHGIHPGSAGGAPWVLNEIMDMIFQMI